MRVPSKIPQFTESRTVPLLTLVMVKWPLPTLVNFHCWQVVPADHSTIPVPLAVPQPFGCTSLPLLTLVMV